MDKNKILTFFFTGLCSHLENKGVINNHEFANHLMSILNDTRFNISNEEREELEGLVSLFLPLRPVK